MEEILWKWLLFTLTFLFSGLLEVINTLFISYAEQKTAFEKPGTKIAHIILISVMTIAHGLNSGVETLVA